jgi:alpha-tubulin suppressor-like RCC1 family protein
MQSHGLALAPRLEGGLEGVGHGEPLLHPEGAVVMHAPTVHLILWGENFSKTEEGREVKAMLVELFERLSSSAYQGILTQYFDASGRVSTKVGLPPAYTDTEVAAPSQVNPTKVEEELAKAIKKEGWAIEENALFMIVTAPGSTWQEGFPEGCAFHSVASSGAIYALVPYQGDPPFNTDGCLSADVQNNPVHKTSKSASHEYAEAATDPLLAGGKGWRSANGEEIGDLCTFNGDSKVLGTAWAQEQYDDHLNRCTYEDLNPPFVYAIAGPPSSVSGTTATLTGTVDAEEPETTGTKYDFEYGTATPYQSTTPTVVEGRSNVGISQKITELLPENTYHFRLVATNSTGSTKSEEGTFVTAVPGPTVSKVEPDVGPEAGGTVVTITGTKLKGNTTVRFGSVPAASFEVTSASSITAVAPPGTGTVDVTVTTEAGTSITDPLDRFSYTAPSVSSVQPSIGALAGGTPVNISGTNFTGATAVRFGSVAATSFTVNSATSITAVSPAGTGSVDVTVTTPQGTSRTSAADRFSYKQLAVLAWGNNNAGELGNGTTTSSDIPTSATLSGESVTAVSSGYEHDLALTATGTALAWGSNAYGQLGNGSTTSSSLAVPVRELSEASGVAGGGFHSLAVRKNGTVMAWGLGLFGQLGGGTYTSSSTPVAVKGLSEATAVAAGEVHSVALLRNGTVMAWGWNGSGQLGNGTTTTSNVPVEVKGLTEVTAIAAGQEHSMALLKNGTVMAWGTNAQGQLGNGTTTRSDVPVAVKGLTEVKAIAAGHEHSLALLRNGTVMAWGKNAQGQLGNGTTTGSDVPVAVKSLSEVSAVAGGGEHSLALLNNGTVMAWGKNAQGQLGNGTTTSSDVPVEANGPGEVVGISGGSEDSLALGAPGPAISNVQPNAGPSSGGTTVTITGPNFTGATAVKFGSTSATSFAVNSTTSITAVSPPGTGTVDVTVTTPGGTSVTNPSDRFSYRPYGVVGWGDNGAGQLGNGTERNSDQPVETNSVGEVRTISAGYDHSLALLKNGTVMAWGEDVRGELGNGANTNSDLPVEVKGLSEVTAIAAGQEYCLALLRNGRVEAWGYNAQGQLGNGTTTATNVPVEVTGLSEVTAISAGGEHSLAVLRNGTVMAWGNNEQGQLGNGTTTSSDVPVEVTGLGEVAAISAGEDHSLAIGTLRPTVTRVQPEYGPAAGGTSVTITGTGFIGASGVKFGSASAKSFAVHSATSITAEAPAGAGTEEVTVTTPKGTSEVSEADQYHYGPRVAGLEPNSGPAAGGTSVTITGTNFTGATAVKFGSTNAKSFTVTSATSITAESSAGSGTVDVTVSTAGGTSPTSAADRFTYGPTVTKVEPSSGPAAGGTSVTITGTGFTGATTVKFGSSNAKFTVTSATSITAQAPAGSGTVDVTVSTAGGTSPTSTADKFTYGPTVTKLAPNSGSASGGTTVTITGTGFTGATAVKFGSSSAKSFTVTSATSITAASPSGTGTVDVSVTTPAGTSPTSSADQFTY